MKLTRLRIVGFKSFVEPTEILIEPGLTGVVGPNGCGKSNLVEALRWAMGESSHKSMRASGMEEVIFAGSGSRPARNAAEVVLALDNERRAPAAFNGDDRIEVSRRIERDAGSTYRVNGREVRARDVQLLFADAATGARSPALVRQGQIGEIIAAKPQTRRRILEDAAGIAGLHARRHEAELRLKAAEGNLVRAEDVLREIEAQVESLRRQSRQAGRYKAASADIRRLEAVLHAIAYAEARDQAAAAERQAAADLNVLADRQQRQTEAATTQAVAAHALPSLREAEAGAAAALRRLAHARDELEAEERRATQRRAELDRHLAEIDKDLAREAGLRTDAETTLVRLGIEDADLARAGDEAEAARSEAEARAQAAEAGLAASETELTALQEQAADLNARRAALERAAREERQRADRIAAERARVARDLAALDAVGGGPAIEALRAEAVAAAEAARLAEEQAARARAALGAAREAETRARAPLNEAERKAQRLETEARTLAKLFAPATGDFWPRAIDAITVEKGLETALGAALGDDLDASTDTSAPAHWADAGAGAADPPLPEGVPSLADFTQAPDALLRRLRQIGVVDKADGPRLRAALVPGQRLVSRAGDLWRWDGFSAAAEAPSAAARRLAEKNRLGDVHGDAAAAREAAARLRAGADAAQAAAKAAGAAETQALDAAGKTRRALDAAREKLSAAERREAEAAAKRSALQEASNRLAASEAEAAARAEEAAAALRSLAPAPDLDAKLLAGRVALAERRAAVLEARASLQALLCEAEMRTKRRESIAADQKSWGERAARAVKAAADLGARRERAQAERKTLLNAPDAFVARRRLLTAEIEAAEAKRGEAADRLAQGETALAAADRASRAALDAFSAAREARAASQARAEAAGRRIGELARAIAEGLQTTPGGVFDIAGLKAGAALPDYAATEKKLAAARAERERLGAVNLRAEEELAETDAKRQSLAAERDDLVEAIKRLRQAIGGLNREGRERLLAAFGVVNGHFQRLFATLFGGGAAELTLVDSDDPLEAGLDILARPPGKKTQTMTLLSGGEQALTAIALIFAVFLTNPSPICVLDEVDAPLDDANVERYCDLLRDMAGRTETRFIVITHNPITMARMDRLFGVTMAERGVSQVVSVDLQAAERFLEAV